MESLGIRCLKFMQDEMKNGVMSNPNLPATPRVKEYFSICTRLINNKETKLGLTQGNWCAAAVSFSLYKSLLPGETPMHGYRVGCIEIQQDLIKSGKWISKEYLGYFPLMLGDIIITDRSNPKDPKTAWWRHILRVSKVIDKDNFECISGNSIGGHYRISKHKITDKNIVGVGAIDERPIATIGIITQDQRFPTEEKDFNPEIDNFYDLYDQIFNLND